MLDQPRRHHGRGHPGAQDGQPSQPEVGRFGGGYPSFGQRPGRRIAPFVPSCPNADDRRLHFEVKPDSLPLHAPAAGIMPVQAGKTAADSAGQDEHRNIAVRPGRLRSDYGNIRIGLHALDAIFRMALRGGSNNYDNRFAILFRPVPRYLGAEKEKHPGSCTFGRTTLWKRGWLSGMIRLYINSMNFRCSILC